MAARISLHAASDRLTRYGLAAVVTFLIFGKIFSPQFKLRLPTAVMFTRNLLLAALFVLLFVPVRRSTSRVPLL